MNTDEKHIFDLIVTHVIEISPDIKHEPITPSSILSPLGMDSIGRAELIARMMDELSLSEPMAEFYKANNLGELASLFALKAKKI